MAFLLEPTMMAFSAFTMWTSSPRMARLAACVAMRPSTRPVASMTSRAPLGAGKAGPGGLCFAPDMGSPDDPAVLPLGEGLDGLAEGEDLAARLGDLGLGGGARAEGDHGVGLADLAVAQELARDDGVLAGPEVVIQLADVDLCPVARRLLQAGSDVSPQGGLVRAPRVLEGADEVHEHRVRFAVDPGCHVCDSPTFAAKPWFPRVGCLSGDERGVYEHEGGLGSFTEPPF